MKVSFTQTYSNSRSILYKFQMEDERLVQFKNTFDLNIYSFHNCEEKTVESFLKVNKLKNIHILKYNFEYNSWKEYTETLEESVKFLKKIGTSSLFFSQDDTLSINDINHNIHDNVKDKFISLSYGWNDFKTTGINDGIFKIYSSKEFIKNDIWAMNDSPYYTDFKFIDELYDSEYYKCSNIWTAERHLNDKFKNIDFNKYVLEKSTFKNINIIGPTSKKTYNKCDRISGLSAKDFIKNKFDVEV